MTQSKRRTIRKRKDARAALTEFTTHQLLAELRGRLVGMTVSIQPVKKEAATAPSGKRLKFPEDFLSFSLAHPHVRDAGLIELYRAKHSEWAAEHPGMPTVQQIRQGRADYKRRKLKPR